MLSFALVDEILAFKVGVRDLGVFQITQKVVHIPGFYLQEFRVKWGMGTCNPSQVVLI